MTAPQTDTTTDPKNVIAALRQQLEEQRAERDAALVERAVLTKELAARTAELGRRNNEYGERINHQTATIDVLQAMSASPADPRPVFDLIARHANELCNGTGCGIFEFDGNFVHLRANQFGSGKQSAVAELSEIVSHGAHARLLYLPGHLGQANGPCHRHGGRRRSTPGREGARLSIPAIDPLMRGGAAIGAISLGGALGGFSDSQIALLRTFAEQAVIAFTSAETYRTLEERTAALARRNSEYGERIEHQSATIDVLKAMSASPGDPQRVFDLIVRLATERCNGIGAALREYDGQLIHHRAYYENIPRGSEISTNYLAMFPMRPSRQTFSGRAILEKRIVHITDIDAEAEVDPRAKAASQPSTVAIPLMRDGVVIGVIALGGERGGFTDSQIELLKTFAEQAVIAITSAETYRALQERTAALAQRNSEYGERIDQQSATIDVLKVMAATPGDPQPAFDLIVRRAQELCNGWASGIAEFDDELIHLRAWHGPDPAAIPPYASLFPMALTSGSLVGRAIRERQIVHVRNADAEPEILTSVRDMGLRSLLAIPLLRDGGAIG